MITVKLLGTPGSPEFAAAEDLKKVFERDVKSDEEGQILIRSEVTCFGQETKDIDIVVFGHFDHGIRRRVKTKVRGMGQKAEEVPEPLWVNIRNFCFCLEVKDHSPERVEFQAERALVHYKSRIHDATSQSNKQKFALKGYLDTVLGWSPWICNFIWFRNIAKDHLQKPGVPHNWIPAEPSLNWILQLAFEQRYPKYSQRSNIITYSCAQNQESEEAIDKFEETFDVFDKVWKDLGKLTRDRIERITKTLLKDQQYAQAIGRKLVSIEGRAGTGKTIKLLHIAHDLCIEHDQRCLILTYNKALVSDIKRLLALARISSDLDAATIDVRTVHSFLRSLMVGFGVLDPISDDDFLHEYSEYKQQLLDCIEEGLLTESDIQKLMKERYDEVNWDIILVDEAQDWPEDEKKILYTIFKPENFIVADGIDQLIRSPHRTNWKVNVPYQRTYEKRSLRQKANLCRFQRHYAYQVGLNWDLVPKDDLLGGKIIISGSEYSQTLHNKLFADCLQSGNKAYEMLFIAPPSLIQEQIPTRKDTRGFVLASEWDQWGIKLWDGTSETIRSSYPTDVDQFRVVQYDSCRGLEGWIVVCLWMGDFFEYKRSLYKPPEEGQLSLGLQSTKEMQLEFAYRWTMIPLTRAIDTLVITLRNPRSAYASLLEDLADRCEDFVEWVD